MKQQTTNTLKQQMMDRKESERLQRENEIRTYNEQMRKNVIKLFWKNLLNSTY